MRAFVRNGGNILPVAALLILALLAPRSQAEGLRPGLVSSDPLWTDRPVRIDPRKQAFERIEGEQKVRRFILRPTNRVQTFDSASFRDAGHLYVLSDVVAADPRQLCRRDGGSPVACGQQARLFLRRLIMNRALRCLEDFRLGTVVFVTCAIGEVDLAETIVAKGAGWAARPRLAARQQEAIASKAGLWIDAECRAEGRCKARRR